MDRVMERLKHLVLPVFVLLSALGLHLVTVREGYFSAWQSPEVVANDIGRVEERLSRQEISLIDFFERLPEQREQLTAGANPFRNHWVEPEPEEEEEPEPEEEEEPEPEEEEPEEEPEPPPPPRRVEVRYVGFVRGSAGESQAYLSKDGAILIGSAGMSVVDDWRVTEFDAYRLLMEDDSGDTFEVEFNRSRTLEIPVEREDG